jgi:hypothetical protein
MKTKKDNFIVLNVTQDSWIVAKGYRLYRYNPETGGMSYFSKIADKDNCWKASFFLTRRLFRAEITHLYHFQGDTWMCIAKKGIFRYNNNSKLFEKCCDIEKGSRPMNLCQAKDGTIYYGEYCFNPDMKPMRIFQSKDNGDTWTVAYEFKQGEINHIHGIFNDPFSDKIWVATGDEDSACIFGYTEDGFATLVRKYQGSQQSRVCVPLFTKDEIIFATDTHYEQNYIRSINRKTGEVSNLQPIQGSGIYAVQMTDGKMLVSTTVEPSQVNKDQWSHLWYSKDGHQWKEIKKYRKDLWHVRYFQFGSIRFPNYEDNTDCIIFTGRALRRIDGKTVILSINDINQ